MSGDPQRFRRLIDLVGDALEHPAGERDAFLASRCGDDAALLAEARALLVHHEESPSRDGTDALRERVVRAAAETPTTHPHPGWIGSYEVLEVLGEGGMGVVYGAREHEPLQRDVAIKVVRAGLASPALLARFEAERQTLARLAHPDIAQVFDAGTTDDGLSYLVMEWVRGEPITDYCSRRGLDLEARLRLFARVCLAVHHAHQKAIIHRDLKPSNVLVTEVDGVPAPKVIDFGIARVLVADTGIATGHTGQGTLLGTLEYMSPEQASWSPDEVDVRSDVYSLGVLLYELLTGTLPFPSETLRAASPVEVQRLLHDTDPPAPSQRIAPSDGTPPGEGALPAGTLPREVDWVVMTALEKDRERRYQSAHALALDIGRLLRHEPVAAAPPGTGYRVAKFVRRHRTATVAGAAVVAALLAGGVAATVGFVHAGQARDAALVEAAKASAVSTFLTGMFASVEPDRARGNVVTVLGVLDSAAARLDREQPFATLPDVEATIRFSIGNSYRELGEYRAAIPMLTRAMELWQASLAPDDERLAMVTQGIGNAHWRRGQYDSALVYAERLLALRTATVPRLDPRYSQAVHILGNARADLGEFVVAESLYRVATVIDSQVLRTATGEVRDSARDNLGTSLNNLGTVLVDQERFDEAVDVFGQSLTFRRTFLPPDSPQIGGLLANLGQAMVRAGQVEAGVDTLEQAAALNARVYGPTHVTTASTWRKLGEAYLASGRLAEAADVLDRARAVYAERSGPRSHPVGLVMVRRGAVRIAAGEEVAGLTEMESGWGLMRDGLGADHPAVRAAAGEIADRHAARGEPERAATWRARATGS